MNSRLFIAIPFPAEVVSALQSLQQGLTGARWVSAPQMHLTLRFLGAVDGARIPLLRDVLARITYPPLSLTVAGTGCFPPRGVPRVLWAGVVPSPPLHALARLVEAGVVAAGLPAELRPFSPHITLARLSAADPREVKGYLMQQHGFVLPPFPVEHFILYASQLTPHGATHTPLASFPLTEGENTAP
jgi:2'-5' RNA ligase